MCIKSTAAILILWAISQVSLFADDSAQTLAKVPRVIQKQPHYQGKPGYVLLIFGDDLTQRRWLAVDGKTAYFDRNGNGDLTDPEDRIEADTKSSDQDELSFNLGEVTVSGLKHHKLTFTLTSLDQLTDRDDAPALGELAPKSKALYLWGEFEIPGFEGRCAFGRVPRSVGPYDKDGYLLLEDDPKHARIVHFSANWSIQLQGQQKLFQGTEKDIILNVGSRGFGAGSFANLGYEKVIPQDQHPHITLKFPGATGAGLNEHQETLKERC